MNSCRKKTAVAQNSRLQISIICNNNNNNSGIVIVKKKNALITFIIIKMKKKRLIRVKKQNAIYNNGYKLNIYIYRVYIKIYIKGTVLYALNVQIYT